MTKTHAPIPAAEPALDAVGLREIAELFGVNERTPHIWRDRTAKGEMGEDPLPAPEGQVSGKPAWRRSTIVAWGQRTGRLDAAGQPTDQQVRRGAELAGV